MRRYDSIGIRVVVATAILAGGVMVAVLLAPLREGGAPAGNAEGKSAKAIEQRPGRDAGGRPASSNQSSPADQDAEESARSTATLTPGANESRGLQSAAETDGELEITRPPGQMSPRLAQDAWLRPERDETLSPRERQQMRGALLQWERLPYRFVREFELQPPGTHLERARLIPLRGLQRAITHSADGRIALWDVRSGAATVLSDPAGEPLAYVTHDETGSVIVAETPYREWQIWETTPPRLLHTLPALAEHEGNRAVRGGWFVAIVPGEEEASHELTAWRLHPFEEVEWDEPVVFERMPRAVHVCTTAEEAVVWTDERLARFALATGKPTGSTTLPRRLQRRTKEGHTLAPLNAQRWLAEGARAAIIDLAEDTASEMRSGEPMDRVGYNAWVRFRAESSADPLHGARLELRDLKRDELVREVVLEPPDELAEATLADMNFYRVPAADASSMERLWISSGHAVFELNLYTGRIAPLPIELGDLRATASLAFLPESGLATVSQRGDVATWNDRGDQDALFSAASLPPLQRLRGLFTEPDYRHRMISLLPNGSLRVKTDKVRLVDFSLPDLSLERVTEHVPKGMLAGGLHLELSQEEPAEASPQRFLALDAEGDVHAALAAANVDEGSDMLAASLHCLSLSREVVLLEFRERGDTWANDTFTLVAWRPRTHELVAAMSDLDRFSPIETVDGISNDGRYWISNSLPKRAGEVDEAEAEPTTDWEAWAKVMRHNLNEHTVVWDAAEQRVQCLIPFPTGWSSSALLADDRVLVRTTGIGLEAWDIHTGRLLAYEPFAMRDAAVVADPYDSQRVAVLPHAGVFRERGAPTVYRIVPQ